jgi:glycosyltransferase involved in cell wall biosynthesis
MISVVIPVLNNRFYVENLLFNIRNNTEKPKEIFIIDDGSIEDIKFMVSHFEDLNIIYIKHHITKGVNYSWNEGIKLSRGDYISVLNSDLFINKYFFKKVKESFLIDSKIGIVCPTTVGIKNKVEQSNDDPVILNHMVKREGWAYSVRTSFIKRIDPIPSFLRTYCGDDYFFYCAKKLSYDCVKISNNYIFHYGSLTLNITPAITGEREKEKIKWNEYLLKKEN